MSVCPTSRSRFLDREVAQGNVTSRAQLVSKALCRMERERVAAHDLEVTIASGGSPYSELAGMLEQLVESALGERVHGRGRLKSTSWPLQPTSDAPIRRS